MIICGSHRYSQPKCRAFQSEEHLGQMVVNLLAATALAVWLLSLIHISEPTRPY